MTEFPDDARQRLEKYLATHYLPKGLGTKEAACSIAAINLALTGKLADTIPECMSLVVGQWIIVIQDAMPDDMRNSAEWKSLLPLAAGTGRKHERERLQVVLEWLWAEVLPLLSEFAEQRGFGDAWRKMLTTQTADAAAAAADAAAEYVAAADAARAARAAADAAVAADAARAARAAADAARAAAVDTSYWTRVNPPALLFKLIAVSEA